MPKPYLDSESTIVSEHCVVIYAPKRGRDRFPDNCVQVYPNESAARAAADADKHLYAARVVGPSRSSEGFMLYYLVSWLE
jgi:hypothetical protein